MLELILNILLFPIIVRLFQVYDDNKKRHTTLISKDGTKIERVYTRKSQREKQEQKSEWSSLGKRVAETSNPFEWNEI